MCRRCVIVVLSVCLLVAGTSSARADETTGWRLFEQGAWDLDDLRDWMVDTYPEHGRVCPVDGEFWFTDTWAEERAWGRTHKGTDIHAERGTPLVAAERGAIVQTGWHWAGGFGVYLLGALTGDVYYYAHLQWIDPGISPGVSVEAGDLLGWVGSTGNADTPHLHFGWMPDHGPGWIRLDLLDNPYELLTRICGTGG